jgi:hypothetical protein
MTDPYGSLDRLWPHTRAWYEGMRRHEPTPLFEQVAASQGWEPAAERTGT